MRTVIKVLAAFLLAVVIIVGGLGVGYVAGGFFSGTAAAQIVPGHLNDGAPSEFSQYMPIFWEAWGIVQNEFYKQPLDPTQMTYGAISGMVDSLGDPHTGFSDPSFAKKLNESLQGSFEGIGATVDTKNGQLVIVAPIKNTPADRAGLQAGDIILKVNDTVIQNMTTDEAVALIRGPKGTKVKLTVQRANKPPFTVEIVRDSIEVPAVEAKMLPGNIGYISLSQFSAPAPDELQKALQDLNAQHPKALILDLRANPGGLLDVAVKVADEFLKPGSTVVVEKFKNGDKQELKTDAAGLAPDIPLVLLVNGGSASASEIIAGAFKDYKRATIIGTTTYGKGSVQVPHQLSDQSQLRVTIAHFFSPQEHEINGVGVKPDIEVPDPTDAQINQNQDPQLDRAQQYLNGSSGLDIGQIMMSLLLPNAPAVAH